MLDDCGRLTQDVASCLGQIPGLELHVLSNSPWVPIRFSRYCASFHAQPFPADDSERLHAILQSIRATRAKILLPVVGSDIRFVGKHRDELQKEIHVAPVPQSDLFDLVSNKYTLAAFLERHSFPSPRTCLCSSLEEAKQHLHRLVFPILLKPIYGLGGVGIRHFNNRHELLLALKSQPEQPFILQSYIPGYDIDCSMLCLNGKILAHTLQRSLFSRSNPFQPDNAIAFVDNRPALQLIQQVVASINWSGIAHVDMRCDIRDQSFHIVDFNARFWGTLLGSQAAGINFPYLCCLAALGIAFAPPAHDNIDFFTTKAALKRMAGLYSLRKPGPARLCRTELPYLFDDPAPGVFAWARKSFEKCAGGFKLPRR
jgi:predicted ATP-grasp superfamily ATP-dependent carboligase